MESRDDDRELSTLLQTWQAPEPPPTLRQRVIRERRPRWHWLLTGSIRIPVPIAVAAALLVVWVFTREPRAVPDPPGGPTVSLADFEPVPEIDLRIVGESR
jgi:hypothetical protein